MLYYFRGSKVSNFMCSISGQNNGGIFTFCVRLRLHCVTCNNCII